MELSEVGWTMKIPNTVQQLPQMEQMWKWLQAQVQEQVQNILRNSVVSPEQYGMVSGG